MDKPKIRAVELFPIEENGERMVVLRDPGGLAPVPIRITLGAYHVIAQFNGQNDLRDIQAAFMKQFGQMPPLDKLQELVTALDTAYFLDSPRFAERAREVREQFLAAPERAPALAGLCYAREPVKLRLELAAYFDPPEGPGRAPAQTGKKLAGLIAPHIDPPRGGAAYAHAYAELMAHQPPELVIILGTSHYGAGPELFSATRKPYATPLGTVATDVAFVERLAARYRDGDLFGDEILHRNEHSIEFQALFLAYALGTRGFQVVPILVSSFHEMVSAGSSPAGNRRVRGFIEALGELLAAERRNVLVLAGVDFAHVGKKFGDGFAADQEVARRVQREDLALIENIQRGDAAGFFSDIAKDRDARKICGLSPMYTQLELLRGRAGRLLKYGIAMEPQTESCVSFASLAIE